jgi:threonine dehydrogenase-like Zn-dependent dehydrogenase
VHRLPDSVDFRRGAYAEPVAASIAVLHSGIEPHERGLIFGRNRIAELTLRILRSRGFTAVEIWEPAPGEALESRACAYDFVIETVASAESFAVILELLRARGRFVLKSRKQQPVPLNIARAVQKEIFFSSVNYGDFDDALALLAGEALAVEDLFGQSHPLDDFEAVFAAGERGEALKLFFEPGSRR